jgi:hypothetical protein
VKLNMTEEARERIGWIVGSHGVVPSREGKMDADDEESGERGRGPRR